MLADHPFLDVLWTGFLLFLWVGWIFLVVMVLMDIFRRDDFSGAKKAIWALAIVVVPWLGVLIYLITQGDGMTERRWAEAEAARTRVLRRSAPVEAGGGAAEIERAKALLDDGAITPAEFEQLKARAMA